jgi:hypothetical protein
MTDPIETIMDQLISVRDPDLPYPAEREQARRILRALAQSGWKRPCTDDARIEASDIVHDEP